MQLEFIIYCIHKWLSNCSLFLNGYDHFHSCFMTLWKHEFLQKSNIVWFKNFKVWRCYPNEFSNFLIYWSIAIVFPFSKYLISDFNQCWFNNIFENVIQVKSKLKSYLNSLKSQLNLIFQSNIDFNDFLRFRYLKCSYANFEYEFQI